MRQTEVPSTNACWSRIAIFALTFNGYDYLGKRCGAVASGARRRFERDGRLPRELGVLRACLFFEERAFRHTESTPTRGDMKYLRAVVEAIGVHVER